MGRCLLLSGLPKDQGHEWASVLRETSGNGTGTQDWREQGGKDGSQGRDVLGGVYVKQPRSFSRHAPLIFI